MEKIRYQKAKELLRSYGVKVVKSAEVKTEEEAIKKAGEIGFPVVLEVDSPDVIHKSDRGYIKLDIGSKEEFRKAFKEMKKKTKEENIEVRGYILQKMIKGKEVIIGGKRDPQFGPVVLFGLGGIFVQIYKDTTLRVAPIDKEEAFRMMGEIKSYPILTGARGEEKVNLDKLAEIIVSVGKLMTKHEEIKEMDLNPVMVNSKEAYAVDLRIITNMEGA